MVQRAFEEGGAAGRFPVPAAPGASVAATTPTRGRCPVSIRGNCPGPPTSREDPKHWTGQSGLTKCRLEPAPPPPTPPRIPRRRQSFRCDRRPVRRAVPPSLQLLEGRKKAGIVT